LFTQHVKEEEEDDELSLLLQPVDPSATMTRAKGAIGL
jgi:hypothetical protein